MPTNSRFAGEITITPHLNWNEIQATQLIERVKDGWEVKLVIDAQETETPDGTLTVKTCSRIEPWNEQPYAGYHVEETLQEIIDQHPDHTFSGFFDCRLEDGSYLWRIVIKDRKVLHIEPKIVWPEP